MDKIYETESFCSSILAFDIYVQVCSVCFLIGYKFFEIIRRSSFLLWIHSISFFFKRCKIRKTIEWRIFRVWKDDRLKKGWRIFYVHSPVLKIRWIYVWWFALILNEEEWWWSRALFHCCIVCWIAWDKNVLQLSTVDIGSSAHLYACIRNIIFEWSSKFSSPVSAYEYVWRGRDDDC